MSERLSHRDGTEAPERGRGSKYTNAQVERVAAELRSQERYNPAWCKPGSFESHSGLYRQRAILLLEAAR